MCNKGLAPFSSTLECLKQLLERAARLHLSRDLGEGGTESRSGWCARPSPTNAMCGKYKCASCILNVLCTIWTLLDTKREAF